MGIAEKRKSVDKGMREGRDSPTTLSGVDVDDLLDHSYRRYLLYYLYLFANPVQLPDVAHQITIWKTNEPADDHLQKRLRIYSSLYHDHIPELIDIDVVDYDQDEDMIELGSTAKQLIPAVERKFRAEITDLLQAEHCTFNKKR